MLALKMTKLLVLTIYVHLAFSAISTETIDELNKFYDSALTRVLDYIIADSTFRRAAIFHDNTRRDDLAHILQELQVNASVSVWNAAA